MAGRIIAIANTKGGVGKSTITGNLAWALSTLPGGGGARKVLVVDTDHQASVTKWFDLAEEVPFERLQLTTVRLLQHQAPKFREQFDLVLLDCPPMQGDITAAALCVSDLGLVPVQPSPLDMLAYSELVPLLHQAQAVNPALKLFFVVNGLS